MSISLFNESTAIPFTELITTPIHPGIQLGSELDYKTGMHSRLFQTINASCFYHNYLALGVGLATELGYELRTGSGLAFTSLLGVGYMHTFSVAEEFTFSNDRYEKKSDRGNPRFIPSIAIELGYYIQPENLSSPKIFIRYHSWVEYPYSPGFIPIMTHINLHVGLKLFIQETAKK